MMHSSPFSVAGMSTSGGPHHHNTNLGHGWGSTSASPAGPLTSTFSDSLSQSRSQYQPGYLMSTQPGSPRADEAPIVQTKAKMNQVLVRGKTSEFGMDSMFESSRKRNLADDDAPPMTSVFDIPNETYVESKPTGFQSRPSNLGGSSLFKPRNISSPTGPTNVRQSSHQQHQPLYIIVFGYPPDRYSVTVEYFRELGETTEPEHNNEIVNCFRLGFNDPGDAMRAVRKNGEVLCGSFMVGVKWADPGLGEALFGQFPLFRSTNVPLDNSIQPPTSPGGSVEMTSASPPQHGALASGAHTPSFGTPIRLAPSAAAFRRSTAGAHDKAPQQSQGTPLSGRSWVSGVPGGLAGDGANISSSAPWSAGGGVPDGGADKAVQNRGMLGQVSDLLFGW